MQHTRVRIPILSAVTIAMGCGVLQLAALKAAGFTGSAPKGASVITKLVSTLSSNWEWLIATGVGLVLVLIAGLMMFGSQRAPDHLFRVIAGIMLVLVVIPAVLA
jgi:uncharacterized membrane protein